MIKKMVLWVFVAGLLLITLVSCHRESPVDPTFSTFSEESITPSQADSLADQVISEDTDSKATSSQALAPSSEKPTSESSIVPSQMPSEKMSVESWTVSSEKPSVESSESILSVSVIEEPSEPGSFGMIFLFFKPECIPTAEERSAFSFFSEPLASNIDSIYWNSNQEQDYTVRIALKESTEFETCQAIRAALLERNDLLKIRYALRGYVHDPINNPIESIVE